MAIRATTVGYSRDLLRACDIYGIRDRVFDHRVSILPVPAMLCPVVSQFTRRRKRQRDAWHDGRTATARKVAAASEEAASAAKANL